MGIVLLGIGLYVLGLILVLALCQAAATDKWRDADQARPMDKGW